MARMKLIFLKSSGDFSKMMPENSTSITDIGYSIEMKVRTKGITSYQSVIRFKTKAQVEVWHRKWDVLEHEEEEDISEYVTCFKKIYKRVNPQRRTPIRTIIWKFINSLPPKYVKLLTIIESNTLEKAIEVDMNVEASQKVKAYKRNQAYMVDIIEELRQEIYNIQVAQIKLWQSKSVTLAESLQGTRNQIMPYRGRERLGGRGCRRDRGGFNWSGDFECWTCRGRGYMSEKCPESQCFLCYKKGHIVQFCPEKSVNLVSIEDEANLNYIKGTPRKMEKVS